MGNRLGAIEERAIIICDAFGPVQGDHGTSLLALDLVTGVLSATADSLIDAGFQ